jgi:hypothetical protein
MMQDESHLVLLLMLMLALAGNLKHVAVHNLHLDVCKPINIQQQQQQQKVVL